MLKIINNRDITRGGVRIGWVEGNDIRDHENKKLGYFTSNDIYKANGIKAGFIQGNNLYFTTGRTVRLDDLNKEVMGGSLPNLARAAILVIIGD
jgi:hypothetical protein